MEYGKIDISLKNDSLLAKVESRKVWLKHYHYDVFDWIPIDAAGKTDTTGSNLKFNFASNIDGKIESFSAPLEPGMNPTNFTLIPKVIKVDAKTLEQYVGDYTRSNMEVNVSVKEKVLYVYVPGQSDYETVAIGNHTFNLKALKGYSVKFETKGNEKAGAVFFIQPNGTFKGVRKSK